MVEVAANSSLLPGHDEAAELTGVVDSVGDQQAPVLVSRLEHSLFTSLTFQINRLECPSLASLSLV